MDTRAGSPDALPVPVTGSGGRPEWGSDLIVDMLRLLDIEYAALLPGSTFRGIHDSLVNYTANHRPQLILCAHEMVTVAMARGYARVTGRPMVAIVHNVVGLLNATMSIYDAWCDRVPVIILGGTGPLDAATRRPFIDWIHTANVQGDLVRGFTKWDDQPASIAAIPGSLLRAYRAAVTEPAGPVYVCFDVDLQEQALPGSVVLPDPMRYRPAAPPAPDPAALREAAELLLRAELPLCFADRVGNSAQAVGALVELAELLAMPVVDLGTRWNFPTPHDLDFHGAQSELLREANVVLGLDVTDLDGAIRPEVDHNDRSAMRIEPRDLKVIHISLDEMIHRGLTGALGALPAVDLPILAGIGAALPMLLDECRRLAGPDARTRIEERRRWLAARQRELRARQRRYVQEHWDRPQISEARLAGELWAAIKDEDFFITGGQVRTMAPGVYSIPGSGRHLGQGGGGAVGTAPGVALGAALALKDDGRLPVAILGDGELYLGIQALWTAAHYRVPALWIVNNNRTYLNDEAHQEYMAKVRKRPPENRTIGIRIEDPEPDFAAHARALGLHGAGPITEAKDLRPAIHEAVEQVKRGQMAIVDVWTERSRG